MNFLQKFYTTTEVKCDKLYPIENTHYIVYFLIFEHVIFFVWSKPYNDKNKYYLTTVLCTIHVYILYFQFSLHVKDFNVIQSQCEQFSSITIHYNYNFLCVLFILTTQALQNTRMLATYASIDSRVSQLGYAIKHLAKVSLCMRTCTRMLTTYVSIDSSVSQLENAIKHLAMKCCFFYIESIFMYKSLKTSGTVCTYTH